MGERMVLLYGRSMLLSLVAAGLDCSPDLRVERASTWAEASQVLAASLPETLIFDLTATSESHILPLLFRVPDLLLIGLDTETNHAVLVSSRETRSLTMGQIRGLVAHG